MHSAHNIMYKFKLAQPVSLGLHSPALYPLHTVQVWSCFSTQAACVSGLGFPLCPQDPFPITLGTFFKNVEPLTHLIRMPTCPRCYTFTHLSTGVCIVGLMVNERLIFHLIRSKTLAMKQAIQTMRTRSPSQGDASRQSGARSPSSGAPMVAR